MSSTPRLKGRGTPASLRANRTPAAALSSALSGKRGAATGTGTGTAGDGGGAGTGGKTTEGEAMVMSPVPLKANGRVVLGDVAGSSAMAPPKRRWSVTLSGKKAAEADAEEQATDAAAKEEDEENMAEVPMPAAGEWSPGGAKVQVRKGAGHRTPNVARTKKSRMHSPA